MLKTIYLFLNGPFNPPKDFPEVVPDDCLVVAVDGGANHCLKLGWRTDIVLGDFDSLSENKIQQVEKLNPDLEIIRYNAEKDETDFELALSLLSERRYRCLDRLEVMGALGGRWDMTIANLATPLISKAADAKNGLKTVFRDGQWDIFVLIGPATLDFSEAEIMRRFSILPLSPSVTSVKLIGDFKYPLNGEELFFAFTRGLSNELGPKGGTFSFETGYLLATVSPLDE